MTEHAKHLGCDSSHVRTTTVIHLWPFLKMWIVITEMHLLIVNVTSNSKVYAYCVTTCHASDAIPFKSN